MKSIMGSLRHFAPFAAIVGYVAMYWSGSKGVGQIIPDLENISISNLTANYQNLLIAAGAGVAIYMLKHVSLPALLKDLLTLGLYALIGWQIALAIDPPAGISHGGRVAYVPPATYNPYALTSGGT